MIVEQVIIVLNISNECSSSSDFCGETIKKITKNERKSSAHSEKRNQTYFTLNIRKIVKNFRAILLQFVVNPSI